jgi:NTP pyrophosphatase (non-canonical NTP hydrolase)
VDLSEMQRERDVWVARNFPGDDMPHSLLGAVEELGELAHHYLKLQQGIRGDEIHHREEMGDAVADCVIFLAGVCSFLDIDFGTLVQDTWDTVKQRDWVAFPQNGIDT